MKEYQYHCVLKRGNERVGITDYHDSSKEALDEALEMRRQYNRATAVILHISRLEKYRVDETVDGPKLRKEN